MKIDNMKIHHIGIACENINEGIEYVKSQHKVTGISETIFDPLQNATVCLLNIKDAVAYELVSGEVVKNFISRGVNIYHICYETEDINATIQNYIENGASLVTDLKPAKLFNGRLVCFLQTKFGLIELLEVEKNTTPIELKKTISEIAGLPIVISGTFTAEPLKDFISYFLDLLNIKYSINFSPYNQIFQQLIDDGSIVTKNTKGINIFFVNFFDWAYYFSGIDSTSINKFINSVEKQFNKFVELIIFRAKKSSASFMIVICKPDPKLLENKYFFEKFEELENKIFKKTFLIKNIHLIDSRKTDKCYPVSNYFDNFKNEIAHIPYNEKYFLALATITSRQINLLTQQPYKVLVVDCDGILWAGACGELGACGVEVREIHKKIQEFILEQINIGKLVCLCSKNNEADVLSVFEKNPNMILKLEYIIARKINWRPKSENIKELANELKLSLDSFIFIDDNPIECKEVEQNIPEMLTLNFSDHPMKIEKILNNNWSFDHRGTTEEDKNRTKFYKENILREDYKSKNDLLSFIDSLKIKIKTIRLTKKYLDRADQLLMRTNQFNFSTKRYSIGELKTLIKNPQYYCTISEASDKFGKYGFVNVIIAKIQSDTISIETFLLSCRVLGRGIEHKLIANLADMAIKKHKKFITIEYCASPKNELALKFISSLPFKKMEKIENVKIYTFLARDLLELKLKVASNNLISDESKKYNPANPERIMYINGIKKIANLNSTEDVLFFIKNNKVNFSDEENSEIYAPNIASYLTKIWKEVLNLNFIDPNDSFFDLGGDSIHAIHILARIKNSFSVELGIRDIFENPKFSQLKDLISIKLQNKEPLSNNKTLLFGQYLEEAGPQEFYPLSFAQQALWDFEQAFPSQSIYNMPLEYYIEGDLNIDALEFALQQVSNRHPALRTVFVEKNGIVFQKILNKINVNLQVESLIGAKKNKISELIALEEKTKFDLKKGPLFRVKLFQILENKYLIFFTIHHIIFDGTSYNIFLNDLSVYYNHFSDGNFSALKPLSARFVDFIQWEIDQVKIDTLISQANYWKDQLKKFVLHEIKSDCPPEKNALQPEGRFIGFKLDFEISDRIKNFAAKYGVSLFTLFSSIFTIILYTFEQTNDVSLGAIVTTRKFQNLENVIGFFVNAIVLKNHLSKDLTFEQILLNNKATVLNSFENQDIPFGKVIEEYQKNNPSIKNAALFQAIFLMQNSMSYELHLNSLKIKKYRQGYDIARADLVLELQENNKMIFGGFYYNANYFSSPMISDFISRFEFLSEKLVKEPKMLLEEIVNSFKTKNHNFLLETK